jgi:hypothetical protein
MADGFGDDVARTVIGVRADTNGFARDVADMRATLEGGLGSGADRAGRAIEASLLRAVRSGKMGFDDLKATALSALAAIAAEALKAGIATILGGGSGGKSDAAAGANLGATLAAMFAGQPGRATGGPVAPGRGYIVGERGPELFVPTASGRVEPGVPGGGRDVRVAITINAGAGEPAGAMARSSRQVARAVREALARE